MFNLTIIYDRDLLKDTVDAKEETRLLKYIKFAFTIWYENLALWFEFGVGF